MQVKRSVAPRAGAWIETFDLEFSGNADKSHPVRVRGLKQSKVAVYFCA